MRENHLRVASGHKIDSLQTVRFQRMLDEEILPRLERPGRYVGPFEARGIDPKPADPSPFALVWPSVPDGADIPGALLPVAEAARVRWGVAADIAYAPGADLETELIRSGLPLFSCPGWHPLGAFGAWLVWMQEPGQLLGLLTLLRASGLAARAADRDASTPRVLAAGPGARLGAEILRPFCDAVLLEEEPAAVLDLLADLLAGSHPDQAIAELLRRGIDAGIVLTSQAVEARVAGEAGGPAKPDTTVPDDLLVAPVTAWDLQRSPVETSTNASGTPVTTLRPWAASQRLRERCGLPDGDWLVERIEAAFGQEVGELIVHLAVALPGETSRDRAAIPVFVRDVAARANQGPKQVVVIVSPYVPGPGDMAAGARPAPPAAGRAWMEALLVSLRSSKVRCFTGDPASAWVAALLAAAPAEAAPVVERMHAIGARVGESALARSVDLWQKALQEEGFDARWQPRGRAEATASVPGSEALARVLEPGDAEGGWSAGAVPPERTGLRPPPDDHGALPRTGARAGHPSKHRAPSKNGGRSAPSNRWKRWQTLAPRQFEYRIEFAKQGRLRHVGHRELSALVVRACREAGLPLATAGLVQPRPKIVFGPPLPVGVEGLREYVDISLTRKTSDLRSLLSRRLPDGFVILDACFIPAASTRSSLGQLACAEYECTVAARHWIDGTAGPRQLSDRIASLPGEGFPPQADENTGIDPSHQVTGIRVQARDDTQVRFAFVLDLTSLGAKCKPRDVLALLLGDLVEDLRLLPLVRTRLLTRLSAASPQLLTPMEQVRTMIRELRARERHCA